MKVTLRERRRARIEIIPLIDVTFLLLVFFIYLSLSMSLNKGLPLQLPSSKTAESHHQQKLVVSLDSRGRIYLEGSPIAEELLAGAVRDRMARFGVKVVELRGHRLIPYERVVGVLDILRQAGAARVVLETQQEGKR